MIIMPVLVNLLLIVLLFHLDRAEVVAALRGAFPAQKYCV